MLLFKYTVANHRQNIICFHILGSLKSVRKDSKILLIVNHFTKIPSLRYFTSCYTDEKAYIRYSFLMGQLGCSILDALLQRAAYIPTCSHSPQISSTKNILELAGLQRVRDNTY